MTDARRDCAICDDLHFLRDCGETDDAIARRLGFARRDSLIKHERRHREAS